MTELLYQTDSYLREFDCDGGRRGCRGRPRGAGSHGVLSRRGRSAGRSGGADLWRRDRVSVTQVKKEGELVWHWLDGGLPAEGQAVTGSIDWPRRYALMRTHTAMHILCGVVWRDYGASVTGGNMDPLQGRMDFEFATLRAELVGEIEAKCNAEIAAARDVRVKILPREEAFQIPDLIRTKINLLPEGIKEIRTVEIVGLDLQADGGTHVANTREVGRIKVTDYKSKGAINKRIYIEVGDE